MRGPSGNTFQYSVKVCTLYKEKSLKGTLSLSLPILVCIVCALFLAERAGGQQSSPAGRFPSTCTASPIVVKNGDRSHSAIALTFDACSARRRGQYDERITKVLLDFSVPATIFLGGKWAEENPEVVRQLAAIPQFELGNHTYSHPHLAHLTDSQIRRELWRTQNVLRSLSGKEPVLFRPPFGEYDGRIVGIAAEMGLMTIEYDLPSGDPDTCVTKERLVAYVSGKARNGSIIVMHINRRGWNTAAALPEIIKRLRKKGFAFVKVGDLLLPRNQKE